MVAKRGRRRKAKVDAKQVSTDNEWELGSTISAPGGLTPVDSEPISSRKFLKVRFAGNIIYQEIKGVGV